MHALDHQLHVVEGRACGGEAGAGLDIVRPRLTDDVAHFLLFLVGQQAGRTEETQTHLAIYRKGGCDISSPRSYSDYYLLVFR